MRKLKILFVLFTLVVSFFLYCGDASTRSQLKEESVDYITEGWIDDNTFQVRTIGAPNPKAKGFVKRRTQSEEAALISAQKRVVELMVGAKVSGTSKSESGELESITLTKELEGVVKGGAVIKKSFDKEDNCEITYRIHANGLKEMTEATVTKN